jgi:hypothetical protein
MRARRPKLCNNGNSAHCYLKTFVALLAFLFTSLTEQELLGERLTEKPLPLPFYFMEPSDLSMATNLSFQVTSLVGQPAPTVVWPTPKDKPQCSYVPVSSEQRGDTVRIWYQRIDSSEAEQVNQRVLCVVEGTGGRFEIPKIEHTLSPWPDEPNVLMRRSPHRATWGGFNVHQIISRATGPKEAAPYSMLYWDQPAKGNAGGLVAFSQDGLHWEQTNSSAVFTEYNDAFTLIWNKEANEYWLYQTKLEDWPDKPYPDNLYKWRRVMSLRRSRDLKSWSPQEVILRPDDQDPKALEFYLLKVFRYGSRFAGLLMRYQGDPNTPRKHASHTTTELILSDDGKNWRRPFREVDMGFWSYADGFTLNGKLCFVTGGKTGLALRQLRPQGLVSCGNSKVGSDHAMKGIGVTHLFKIPRNGLRLNFEASHGVLEAELLDEQGRAIPGFTADQGRFEGVDGTGTALKWGKKDLSQLENRAVRLRFFLQGARVYGLTQGSF